MANVLIKNILKRLPAALVLILAVSGILYFQNTLLIYTLIVVVVSVMIFEWLQLSDSRVDILQVLFFIFLTTLLFQTNISFLTLFLFISSFFWLAYAFVLFANKKLPFLSFDNNYLGSFLIFGFLLGLIYLLEFAVFSGFNRFFIIFIVLLSTVLIDVGAYLVGSSLGKTPLFPLISPNKTLEGLLGGAILVLIFNLLLYFFDLISIEILFILIISIPFGFIGDYFESSLKRTKSVKDSGSLIPGHGGIWDRLDSHIAVIPVFSLLTIMLI